MENPYLDSSLTSLFVFLHTINTELIRCLHVYQLKDGKEKEVEREFLFSVNGPYTEMEAKPLILERFKVSDIFEGQEIDLWLCIFAFHVDHHPLLLSDIPPLLYITRNPKLKSIPALANDLKLVFNLSKKCRRGKGDCCQSKRNLPVLDQDLNCLPYSVGKSELPNNQETESSGPGKRRKRAASENVARIALEDIVKYFDVPTEEASRNLKVGLTVLKKCRQFGIPRWPHRKIKSLGSLINDLQEEEERQKQENEDAAKAVRRRQKMLEKEKEAIERKPFIEIQIDTKRFRQDVFKRRHRARVLGNQQCMNESLCVGKRPFVQ